jgi:inner membrane protein
MASVGHLAVGLAAARVGRAPEGVRPGAWALGLSVLAFLPDADVIAFRLGIPYGAPWGHRGAAHSIAFAVAVAALLAAVAAGLGQPPWSVLVTSGLVLASHGLLDALTDGGKGIALAWPLTSERFFSPWRPIPVAPIGRRILSGAGLRLMVFEALVFAPFWIVAAWPRRRSEER